MRSRDTAFANLKACEGVCLNGSIIYDDVGHFESLLPGFMVTAVYCTFKALKGQPITSITI